MPRMIAVGVTLLVLIAGPAGAGAQRPGEAFLARRQLQENWLLKSSYQVKEGGNAVSTCGFVPAGWHPTRVPATVLSTLIRRGVYPDLRVGLNSFRIPDASDEFNRKHDLAKYSYLPDGRNPWKDPYWYRTEFTLPPAARGKRVWLDFDGIHYRADVWLNGRQVADARQVAGSFSRYRFDVTAQVRFEGKNCLAVKVHPMDHPGTPGTQLDLFGKDRPFHSDSMRDVGLVMFLGYDCMPTVPDRNTGLWQRVYLDFTGPVDIRHPFVTTRLPLPQTSPARLEVSAALTNASAVPVQGVLKGTIDETGGRFEKPVNLSPGETKEVEFSPGDHPALVIQEPRLWWPKSHGPQNLYHLALRFETGGQASDEERVAFGIRQITRELYQRDGAHGLRLYVNGQRVFCRGGYLQPEILFDWDAQRMETEIRYLTEANINIVYFEDIPNPPDEFLDLCDRYGLMFGNCFYGCYWMRPGMPYPEDLDLLARGTVDIIRRYRNHPSLVLYMAMNEGETREDVYTPWRKEILSQDGTRLFIPSGSFPDYRKDVPAWIKPDTPVGINDYPPKSYGWVEPAQFYRWVRNEGNWMFMLESGCPSPPPVDSLRRFLPGVENAPPDGSPHYPLNSAWAHHDACHYFGPYDAALRRLFGQPTSAADYCAKANLLTADEHRAMFEAANHRMWDITSGFSEWKLNACWPSVEWQIYDWYLRPTASYYPIKRAGEPLHVQLTPLDWTVVVVNNRLEPQAGVEVLAKVCDLDSKVRWQKTVRTDMPANCFKEIFTIPGVPGLTPVYFVQLQLKNRAGGPVSDNFYWLTAKSPTDLARLDRLPMVRLSGAVQSEHRGRQTVASVKVTNPTDHLAFFVHLVLTKGPGGDEILPVFWDDNDFSLLPGQSLQLTARFAAADAGSLPAALEVGGWNIESDYRCLRLKASKGKVRAGEPVAATAEIANTLLGGSRVNLLVDGQRADTRWAWARGERVDVLTFRVNLTQRGTHRLAVGNQTARVEVQ